MSILKFIIVGAAVGYGINYITKKGPDGRSIADNLVDKASDWFNDARELAVETIEQAKRHSPLK